MKKAAPKPPPFVVVQWHDAAVSSGWADGHDGHSSHLIVSAGWLVNETERDIVIAGDFSPDPRDPTRYETNRRLAVPKAWVKKLKRMSIDQA
jgi:hypothetical protein